MSASRVLCKPGGATPGDSLSCVCCLCHCSVLRERRAGTSLSQHPEPSGEGAVARVWAVGSGRWAVAAAGPQRKHRPFPSVNAHIYVLAKMEVAVTKPFSSPVILSRERRRKPSPGRKQSPLCWQTPQAPRGGQGRSWTQQAPQGLALLPAPGQWGSSQPGWRIRRGVDPRPSCLKASSVLPNLPPGCPGQGHIVSPKPSVWPESPAFRTAFLVTALLRKQKSSQFPSSLFRRFLL